MIAKRIASGPFKDRDFFPTPEKRRAIRLLFSGYLLVAFSLIVVREEWSEPYPGPFMPRFDGTGLEMSSPTEAAILLTKIRVDFSDRTTAQVSQEQLLANIPSSSIPFILSQMFAGLSPGDSVTTPSWAARDDVRSYFHRRLVTLYPGKMPVRLTFLLYRETFSLNDYRNRNSLLVNQVPITWP